MTTQQYVGIQASLETIARKGHVVSIRFCEIDTNCWECKAGKYAIYEHDLWLALKRLADCITTDN